MTQLVEPQACAFENPVEPYLRTERMPHIWCPGCGIGTTVNCFVRAIEQCQIDLDKLSIVSGIGCTGRVAGYLRLDSFHTTHGRAIPFATGLKLANPELKVVVYSGDGDLIAIGGNHFIHAARRNVDLTVICVNNFNYAMTGGQAASTTPIDAVGTTAPYGVVEKPFNLPFLAESCGATYVARWTAFHVRQLTKAMIEAINKKGFSFVEVITPCPTLYERRNRLGSGLDRMQWFKDNSIIKNNTDTRECDIEFQKPIICGRFVDVERPSLLENIHAKLEQIRSGKRR
ncbi:MAG TPA: 2-oxoacid:ferredoxin oxidoreductase subunit beta [Phycisphaerae bacterium]|nr:2-oxoacid:ferredoxin oxidoreductase subunit beta [Phycisphaerae bacterium]HNU46461.1 2-oxoacid:ferredoxin oxidoreductase subunit beta [Phycisphaerae bacterium]